METALWLASHLSCFPGLGRFLQGFLQEFLQGFCGLFLKPTLSQLFPRNKLQKLSKTFKNSLKTIVFQFFLTVTDSFPTLSQNSWERVGKELGKSWERVGKEPTRPGPFARFWAIFLIPCKGSCGLSCSVPCRLTLSQLFPRGP